MKYESRAEWGARPARSHTALRKARLKGMAVHYSAADSSLDTHDKCERRVQGIQNYHMDTKRWADIAYSWLVCRHGIIFEGRGWGVRTAANGTDAGNDAFHAVCYLDDDGPSTDLTAAAAAAMGEVVRTGMARGLGTEVRPHSWFKKTGCPGDELRAWIAASGWTQSAPSQHQGGVQDRLTGTLRTGSRGEGVRALQSRLWINPEDGIFGPATEARVKDFQALVRLSADGIVGPKTEAALARYPRWFHRLLAEGARGGDVRVVQNKVRAIADGIYGPHTAAKVRGFQAMHGLTPDGVVRHATALSMGE